MQSPHEKVKDGPPCLLSFHLLTSTESAALGDRNCSDINKTSISQQQVAEKDDYNPYWLPDGNVNDGPACLLSVQPLTATESLGDRSCSDMNACALSLE
jgi:hypothetical protein